MFSPKGLLIVVLPVTGGGESMSPKGLLIVALPVTEGQTHDGMVLPVTGGVDPNKTGCPLWQYGVLRVM